MRSLTHMRAEDARKRRVVCRWLLLYLLAGYQPCTALRVRLRLLRLRRHRLIKLNPREDS
jgi:hypothetical protein